MTPERLHCERGATIVETAIAFSMVVMLVFGVIDFSRWMIARNEASTASTTGARYAVGVGDSVNGIPRYTDCDEIRSAALAGTGNPDLTASSISVAYDNGPGTAHFDICPVGGPGPAPGDVQDRARVVVTVSHSFEFITPFVGIFNGSTTIDSTERRTIFKS